MEISRKFISTQPIFILSKAGLIKLRVLSGTISKSIFHRRHVPLSIKSVKNSSAMQNCSFLFCFQAIVEHKFFIQFANASWTLQLGDSKSFFYWTTSIDETLILYLNMTLSDTRGAKGSSDKGLESTGTVCWWCNVDETVELQTRDFRYHKDGEIDVVNFYILSISKQS